MKKTNTNTKQETKKTKKYIIKNKPLLYTAIVSSFLLTGTSISFGVMVSYSSNSRKELETLNKLIDITKDITIKEDDTNQYETYWSNIFGNSVSINGYDGKKLYYKSELPSNYFIKWLLSVPNDSNDIKISYDEFISHSNLDNLKSSRKILISFNRWLNDNNQDVVYLDDIIVNYNKLSFVNTSFGDYYNLWTILTSVFVIIIVASISYIGYLLFKWNKNKVKEEDKLDEQLIDLEVKDDKTKITSKSTNKSNNKVSSKTNSKSSTKSSKTKN